jgi:hypothetical protein
LIVAIVSDWHQSSFAAWEFVDHGSKTNRMKGPALSASLLCAVALAPAQQVTGDWHGSVEVPNDAPLRLGLHVTTPNTATVDSADEGVPALPVDSITVNGPKLKFEIQSIAGVYQGQIAADSSRITGTWNQDGGVSPLVWETGDDRANITVPISETEAKQKGQACAQWFHEGNLTELWRKRSPVMQQAFGTEGKLTEFREQTIGQTGTRDTDRGRKRQAGRSPPGLPSNSKISAGERNVVVNFAFDPRGAVAAFSIDLGR